MGCNRRYAIFVKNSVPLVLTSTDYLEPQVSSGQTNTADIDWKNWMITVYRTQDYAPELTKPYPKIADNTESISSFTDLYTAEVDGEMVPQLPGKGQRILVDIGGGQFDSAKKWVEHHMPEVAEHINVVFVLVLLFCCFKTGPTGLLSLCIGNPHSHCTGPGHYAGGGSIQQDI